MTIENFLKNRGDKIQTTDSTDPDGVIELLTQEDLRQVHGGSCSLSDFSFTAKQSANIELDSFSFGASAPG